MKNKYHEQVKYFFSLWWHRIQLRTWREETRRYMTTYAPLKDYDAEALAALLALADD